MLWKSVLAILCALALASCSSSGSSKAGSTTVTSLVPGPGQTLTNTTDVPQNLDPCTILTVQQASALAGATVVKTSGGGVGSLDCVYAAGKTKGAEITIKVDSTPAAAQAEFPAWVQPISGLANGLTVKQVANLGDEASTTRNGKINSGIYVRKGALLVKIGTHPAVTQAALVTAVKLAIAKAATAPTTANPTVPPATATPSTLAAG
jgi:hypothetical protein